MRNSNPAVSIPIEQRLLRSTLVLIALIAGLIALTLTGGHGTHLMTTSQDAPMSAPFDGHCGALLCFTPLPITITALTASMLLTSTLVHVQPNFASIILPRLDPPPRAIA